MTSHYDNVIHSPNAILHQARSASSTRLARGFTLIEVMIVVAIVAILASIALPSYTAYVQRSRITEAVSGLAGMKVSLEQYFQDSRTYVGACAAGTVAPLPTAKNFTFSCPSASLTAAGFIVQADGSGNMSGFSYTIDQADVRITAAVPTGWSLPRPNRCWALRADGSC